MTRPGPTEEPHVEEDDRVVRALRGAWAAQSEPDRAALWRAVESRLGSQELPWYARWRAYALAALLAPGRRLALAGVAVLVVGAVFLSGLLGNGDPASAAVLEQVTALSARSDSALADGVLTADEVADLRSRALALLDEVRSDDRALGQLSPAQLKLVVDTLTLVGGNLEGFVAESADEGLVEAVASIRETTTRATDLRRERGDDREGGEDEREATPSTGIAPAGATTSPEPQETHEGDGTPATEGPGDDGEHETEGVSTPAAEATSTAGDSTVTIAAVAGVYTYAAANAGAVTFSFDGKRLALVSVSEAAGWTDEVEEASGSEVRVRFRSGADRITFEVDVLDAGLRISTRQGSSESGEPDD